MTPRWLFNFVQQLPQQSRFWTACLADPPGWMLGDPAATGTYLPPRMSPEGDVLLDIRDDLRSLQGVTAYQGSGKPPPRIKPVPRPADELVKRRRASRLAAAGGYGGETYSQFQKAAQEALAQGLIRPAPAIEQEAEPTEA